MEALEVFHAHVHAGYSFELSASPLLRRILSTRGSPDATTSTSDALSVFMFLASGDRAFQRTSLSMLRVLHEEGRVEDMWRVYKALVSTGNVARLDTEAHLNRLLVALLSKSRWAASWLWLEAGLAW